MNTLKQLNSYKNAFMNNPVAPYVVGTLLTAGGLALLITCSDSNAGIVSGSLFMGTGLLMIALRGYKHYKASQFQDPVLARQNARPEIFNQAILFEDLPEGKQTTVFKMLAIAQERGLGELTTQKDGKTINISELNQALTLEQLLASGYRVSESYVFKYQQHKHREDGDL